MVVHGAVLFGVQFSVPQVVLPNANREQGVVIDLASVVASQEEQSEPVQQPTIREKRTEPESLPMRLPKKERTRRPATIPAIQEKRAGDASHESLANGQPDAPQKSASDSSQPAAADPVPLSSLANPKPVYPELARQRGQEGLVYLRASVDENGVLTRLAIEQSSGYSMLDEAALDAVKKWRFRPGNLEGRPVRGTVRIPVEFRLR